MRPWLVGSVTSAIVSLFVPPSAHSAPGDLDTTFSTDGITTQTFTGTGNQVGNGIAVDGNGRIVVVGAKSGSPGVAAIARFQSNGALDPGFSTDGLQTVVGGCSFAEANAVVVDSSNRVIFAGQCGTDFLIGRLTNTGVLDTTFAGGNGAISPTTFDGSAQAIAMQPDGRFVIAGLSGPSTVRIARFTANGNVDTTFDTDGTMTHSFLECDSPELTGIAVQTDGTGRIVAAGHGICTISSVTDPAVIMLFLNSNGTLDTNVSVDGVIVDRFGQTSAKAFAIGLGASTRITIAGESEDGSGSRFFFLARMTSFGIADPGFDGDGRVVTSFGANSGARALRVQPIDANNVRLLVGGLVENVDGNNDFAVARYNNNGSLDTSFSGDGRVSHGFAAGTEDRILAAALQPSDAKLVVAGGSVASGTDRFAVARYLTSECGNGVLEPGEDCESGSCCNLSTCRLRIAAEMHVCRASTGGCDPAEMCNGVSTICPANIISSNGTVCRPASGVCDVAETCNGVAVTCPEDSLAGAGSPCTSDGLACTTDQCNGSGTCVHPVSSNGTVCRAASGACDVAETCNGSSTSCPNDVVVGAGTSCSDGVFCNGAEQCNGSGTCVSPGNPCTGGAFCANQCSESLDTCNRPAGTGCTSDGLFCTGVEQCNGSGACVGSGDPCPAQGDCLVCNTGTQACEDTDPDGDGHCLAVDTCPAEFNPDQLDTDCTDPDFLALGGCDDPDLVPANRAGCCDGGDVCDVCPANAQNDRCDADLSGGQSIGPGGGTITLGCITITVPAGALSTDTSISMSVGEDDPINPATGQPFSDPLKLKGGQTSVMKIIMLPDNQTFAVPITIDLCWDDRDNDNIVDKGVCVDNGACTETGTPSCDANNDCACGSCLAGGGLSEDNLRLRRDGEIFDHEGFHPAPQDECGDVHQQNTAFCSSAAAPGDCGDTPGTGQSSVALCCNRTGNRWPFKTCYFSEYYFGRLDGALIPGRGSPTTDCQSEWSVVNPFNERELDKRGFLNFDQSCTDGDPSCDGDGFADGACTFEVAVCLNVDDARLVDKNDVVVCDPASTATWELKKPLAISGKPAEAEAAGALLDAVAALGGTIGGARQNVVTFGTPLASEDTCTQTTQIVVPLSGPLADRASRMTFKASSFSAAGSKDADILKLTCLAPED